MGEYVCPLCGCYDYRLDEDGIITYCYMCEENAHGYRPIEVSEEEYKSLFPSLEEE